MSLDPQEVLLLELIAGEADVTEAAKRLLKIGIRAQLGRLSPSGFERLIGRSLLRRGYEVIQCGSSGDGGVDVYASRGAETIVVQCKRYDTQPISVGQVRELLGAVTATKATKGVFITTSSFSASAKEFGSANQIELVDGSAIIAWLSQAVEERTKLICLKCGNQAFTLSEWTKMWICTSCNHLNSLR